MILCVVDDLLFSVKISTAAKALGVEIYFERAADKVVPSIRDRKPSLVILDLNSAKLRPMDVIAALPDLWRAWEVMRIAPPLVRPPFLLELEHPQNY